MPATGISRFFNYLDEMPNHSSFPNRKSNRLSGYNYRLPGYYFLTLCCHKKLCKFGDIKQGIMHLNSLGKLIENCWLEIPFHFPHVNLDEYIVMPNHVHGILVVAANQQQFKRPEIKYESFGKPVEGSVSTIVRSYKSATSRTAKKHDQKMPSPLWQRGYWDRVIRNEAELEKIREYIRYNHLKWRLDSLNPDN